MLEIPGVCKDDLVLIFDNSLCKTLGGCSNLLLCTKISSLIHLTDPITLQKVDLTAMTFFQYENRFKFLPLKENAVEFLVKNIEKPHPGKGNSQNAAKSQLIDVEVDRTSDWETFFVKSHLGDIIHPGDSVLGFDFTSISLPDLFNEKFLTGLRQDAFLVKKQYPERQRKKKNKVKRLNIEYEDQNNFHKKAGQLREKEFDEFLDEMENDPEIRANLDLAEKAVKEKPPQEETKEQEDEQIPEPQLDSGNVEQQPENAPQESVPQENQ
eukprot:TRINITY_DN6770_c0_g1_i1.p1 TRINITY_DN6770_c0_g1~~TRINITY_DN6770_c0_g1_i1.p1  ORF type:complete len:268 (+),score=80.64 TRINITY_DN6770_c0_g1_i1:930-1733(+)